MVGANTKDSDRNVIVITARKQSKRLPNKLLLEAGGKPLICHTVEAALKSQLADRVVVATDSGEIRAEVSRHLPLGKQVVYYVNSDPTIANGTQLCREAMLSRYSIRPGTRNVVNWQADEPCLRPEVVDAIFIYLRNNPMPITVSAPLGEKEWHSRDVVKVAVNTHPMRQRDGLSAADYFSRGTIAGARKHVGVYGYRWCDLNALAGLDETNLGRQEELEQLRWINFGRRIVVFPIAESPLSINTSEDFNAFSRLVESRGNVVAVHHTNPLGSTH